MAADRIAVPTFAYQVSGEYAMIEVKPKKRAVNSVTFVVMAVAFNMRWFLLG